MRSWQVIRGCSTSTIRLAQAYSFIQMSSAEEDPLAPFRHKLTDVKKKLIESDSWLVDCHVHLCEPHFSSLETISGLVRDSLESRVKYIISVRTQLFRIENRGC